MNLQGDYLVSYTYLKYGFIYTDTDQLLNVIQSDLTNNIHIEMFQY